MRPDDHHRQLGIGQSNRQSFFKDTQAITLQQHFKGWVIKTEEPVFNPEEFVMMDYRLREPETTSFTYILPYSKTEALVEFTYFSKEVVNDATYDKYLKIPQRFFKNRDL